jgi:hypothetical protein
MPANVALHANITSHFLETWLDNGRHDGRDASRHGTGRQMDELASFLQKLKVL